MAPKFVQPRVSHLQHPAGVGGLVAIEKEIRIGCIAILGRSSVTIALEHLQRNQRIKKIASRSRMQSQLRAKRLGIKRALCQGCEDVQLKRAEQRLGGPEPKS